MNGQSSDENQAPAELPNCALEGSAGGGANIIRYERRAGQGVQLSSAGADTEVIVIDESTPTPPMPQRQPYVPVHLRRPQTDDEVLYIGPE